MCARPGFQLEPLLRMLCVRQGSKGEASNRHTTEMQPKMQSVLDRNDLDEFMAMVGGYGEGGRGGARVEPQ